MKLDILIPSYFRGQLLFDLLDSINNIENTQTYVCFDSLDDPNILEAPKKYPWVTFLKKENGGLSDTRNFLVSHSKGDYIWFVDDDDLMHEEYREWLLQNVSSLKEPIYKIESSSFDMATGKREHNIQFKHSKKFLSKKDRYYSGPCTWIIKRTFWDENKLQFEKGVLGEDVLFMSRIIKIMNLTNLKIPVIHKSCIWYRIDSSDKNKITNNWGKNFDRFYPLFGILLNDRDSKDNIYLAFLFWKHYMNMSKGTLSTEQSEKMKLLGQEIYKRRFEIIFYVDMTRKFQSYKYILLKKYF